MSKHNIPNEDIPNSEPPPSYEESLNQVSVPPNGPLSSQFPPSQFPPPPQRVQPPKGYQGQPPPQQQHPQAYQNLGLVQNTVNSPNQPTPGDLYSNNPSLPFQYPKGHFCKKCKNTGFKDNDKPCKNCWEKFYGKQVYNPRPELGLRYPRGFICSKCANTGVKRKNGHTCLDCFEKYGPRNKVLISSVAYGAQNIMAQAMSLAMNLFPIPQPNGALPMRVLPGDPRLGGMLCAKCKGSGQVAFFLDTELCPLCGGIGRILNVQLSGYY